MISIVDYLLARIAFKIQLSPSKWRTACDRYETLANYLESDGSLLQGNINDNYPQGSARIQATDAARAKKDEHDVDFITELSKFLGDPDHTLEALFRSLDRGPGSRYHGMCEKRNRCVTVHYADGMHLDVTPARRCASRVYRTSMIPDRRLGSEVIANPEGFAIWFEDSMKNVPMSFMDVKLTVQPIDDQQPVEKKHISLIGLQLNKRWRNLRYENRSGRKPPSIALTKMTADIAQCFERPHGLLDELSKQCFGMHGTINAAHSRGELVRIENPACRDDIFTDRWPGSLEAQRLFLDDLSAYTSDLSLLQSQASMAEKKAVLSRLFGESVTNEVYDEWAVGSANDNAVGHLRHRAGSAGIVAPSLIVSRAPSVATPAHKFFGARIDTKE